MQNIITLAVVSTLFLAAAVVLIVSHIREWRRYQAEDLDAEELEYRRRQYYRRLQTSTLLGVMAIAVFVGSLLTFWYVSRVIALVFWTFVLVLICWVALLAVADIMATRRHFNRVRYNSLIEKAKLEAELRRLQKEDTSRTLRVKTNGPDGPESLN